MILRLLPRSQGRPAGPLRRNRFRFEAPPLPAAPPKLVVRAPYPVILSVVYDCRSCVGVPSPRHRAGPTVD